MKITIKITTKEAIEAWKAMNDHIASGDTVVEIEEQYVYPPSYSISSTTNKCLICGKDYGNTVHQCSPFGGYTDC